MWLNNYKTNTAKYLKWILPVAITLIFGIMTFERTKVWNNSGSLWTDVIEHYPESPYPRTNRANYSSKLALDPAHKNEKDLLYQQAIEDCNVALEINPALAAAYEKRALIYSDLGKQKEAFADANSLIRFDPDNKLGYYIRGTLYAGMNEIDKGLADFNKAISLSPDYHKALSNRGTLFLNYYKKYPEALADFNEAIRLSPQGNYFLNRSICYYKLGDMNKAKADAQLALAKGTAIPDNYRQLLNL
jgi:tetratricopeptide (TPR) repeat protein